MHRWDAVVENFTHGNLIEAIRSGIDQLGKTTETVSFEDFAPIDEYHIGGRAESQVFVARLGFEPDHKVLDIGCGLGGTARLVAETIGCQVSGIDLTPEFVEAGQSITEWLGLSDRVDIRQGNAMEMPFDDGVFDGAMMMHVGMNIDDKGALFGEIARVLRPGGVFGLYDIMRLGDGDLSFPVPWARTAETSSLSTPVEYRAALKDAGFEIAVVRDRQRYAIEFFEAMAEREAADQAPESLGPDIHLGENAAVKIANLVENLTANRVGPIEMIARKKR